MHGLILSAITATDEHTLMFLVCGGTQIVEGRTNGQSFEPGLSCTLLQAGVTKSKAFIEVM